MFGLVLRSRLVDAERRVVKLRVLLHRANDARRAAEEELVKLRADLEAARSGCEFARAEVVRLCEIFRNDPVEREQPAVARQEAEQAVEVPRVLTGLEVVTRATRHRNVHHKALEK